MAERVSCEGIFSCAVAFKEHSNLETLSLIVLASNEAIKG